MANITIRIPEGDLPLLRFYSKEWILSSGNWVKVSIDITGATLQFLFKANKDVADNDGANTVITGNGVAPLVNGEWTAQMTTPITLNPGTYAYKAKVIRSSNPLTVQHGALIVENT